MNYNLKTFIFRENLMTYLIFKNVSQWNFSCPTAASLRTKFNYSASFQTRYLGSIKFYSCKNWRKKVREKARFVFRQISLWLLLQVDSKRCIIVNIWVATQFHCWFSSSPPTHLCFILKISFLLHSLAFLFFTFA